MTIDHTQIALAVALACIVALGIWLVRVRQALSHMTIKYGPIQDVAQEITRLRQRAEAELASLTMRFDALTAEYVTLQQRLADDTAMHSDLKTHVARLEEQLDSIDMALYRPHFTYEDSDTYKAALEAHRDDVARMIKEGSAITGGDNWTVNGSKKEGAKMVKQNMKIMLRAFNAEVEAAVANVSWNNVATMKARIERAFEAVNKQGTTVGVALTIQYRDARLRELRFVYEEAAKRREEREALKARRAAEREEEKAQRELQRAKDEAEREAAKKAEELEKAQVALADASEAERDLLQDRIRELETALEASKERARGLSMAQQTRRGHVYIISNLGSLGDGVVKIGMTRRLDPKERIEELGDASVPFPFDVHALIEAEDAPALELKLHEHFWDRRVNWANDRKEFFRVTLAEIADALTHLNLAHSFVSVPEAREFRETMAALAMAAPTPPPSTEES